MDGRYGGSRSEAVGDIQAGSRDDASAERSAERLATAVRVEAIIAAKSGCGCGVACCAMFCEVRGSHSPMHNASTASAATPASAGFRDQFHRVAPESAIARMRRSIA